MHGTGTASNMEGVAIIGMAARLPGAADTGSFWRNQMAGRQGITWQDDKTLLEAGFLPGDLAAPGLVKSFGMLEGAANFDAQFFGYPPARAEALDPQQRLLLEVAWHAMEHAGYAPGTADGSVGAYLSIAQCSYNPGNIAGLADRYFDLTSRDKDYAASRIAYKLDLTGPSIMIQSASSGSLAAIHMAVEGLLGGQCDMAIAGGCSITLPQGAYQHAAGLMLSASGICRAFDAQSDGAVPGNGLGIVVLKPLAQAMLDQDTIYAVIRGSALNNDGARKTDYLAPGVTGQARVIGEALAVAGFEPETIGYIETHGTGTAIGDPIEIRALTQVFEPAKQAGLRCVLGALKPSIGHLHVASGVAGLIRAALAIYHRVLPPSLGFSIPHPEIDFEAAPFCVNTAAAPWISAGPLRSGVSAFGLGGTNVHVVLEQAPVLPPKPERSPVPAPLAFVLSAKTSGALENARHRLIGYLRAEPDCDLADVAWTLAAGRARFEHRLAVVASNVAEAITALEDAAGVSANEPGVMAETARAWLAGAEADWAAVFEGLSPRRMPLPLYPFESQPYWGQKADASLPKTASRFNAGRQLSHERAGAADVLAWLTTVFAGLLRMPPSSLDPDATYETFGIDSLLVTTITETLRHTYPALRATTLFDYKTLRSLAAHLSAIEAPQSVPRPTSTIVPDGAIAIIGMAGRYPGAGDLDEFWSNLCEGRDSISEVPASRWDWRAHAGPGSDDGCRDRSYSCWGGFIADADKFDALFFGISPREAKLLDPQARLFLEIAWAAIEDAGYTREGLKAAAQDAAPGRDVGVFAGIMHNAYRLLGMEAAASGQLIQSNHWSVPNRISYMFDFTGPSLAVDTACSASLAAVHLACESLRRGECGVALAGGVNLILHPQQPLELSRAGMLSRGREHHAFGAAGDGFVQGEGVGIIVLKPLAAALAQGDHIHAVIRGSAMNAGGKTAGYTVPNPAAQADVVEAALRQAGVEPDSIGYVECHGTGTSLGDPIEIASLAAAFRRAGRSSIPCAIGSVKSNIGHLEAAAGIAGLTKAVMQLNNAALTPSLHATPPNKEIDFAAGPFRVQDAFTPWPVPAGGIRRAGVSSFGAGGANVHIVLEQAPVSSASTRAAGPWLVPLSARDPGRLAAIAKALLARLDAGPVDAGDLAFTLGAGREAMSTRTAFVVESIEDLAGKLARPLLSRPAKETDPATIARLLQTKALTDLAEAFMAGAAIDFSKLYTGQLRHKLSLPAYPFLRERHWLPEPAAPQGGEGRLLGDAIPVLKAEARWRVALDAANPVLAQHCVKGAATLPGVALIALALEAASLLGHGPVLSIKNLLWRRPLTAGPGAEFVLREGQGGLDFELVRHRIIYSSGLICTGGGMSAPISPPPQPAGCEREGRLLYENLAARGISHGPAYRVIETYVLAGAEAFAAIPARAGFEPLGLNLGVLDGALQLTAALIDSEGPVWPVAVEKVDIWRVPPPRCTIYARRLEGENEAGILCFDAVIADGDGQPCVMLSKLKGKVEPRLGDAASSYGSTPPCIKETVLSSAHSQPIEVRPPIMARLFPSGRKREEAPAIPADIPPCFEPVWLAEPAPPGSPRQGQVVINAPEKHSLMPALMAALPGACLAIENGTVPDELVFAADENAACPDRLFAAIKQIVRDFPARALSLTVVAMTRDGVLTPWIASAFALARVAARECVHWNVRCLAVDASSRITDAVADGGDPLGREIVWQAGRRHVRGLRPVTLEQAGSPYRAGGVYLILGGTGGIGLELATQLVTRDHAKVALIGRATPDQARQARIDALGGAAAFFAADACDASSMRQAVAKVRARFGSINGAIHSAIVMQDQSLAAMSAGTFHAALDVKTYGSINFVDALEGERLDWIAFFSSVNSFAANAGQANYVAGCVFKDAYAASAGDQLGCPAYVINWGYWSEAGRVATPIYRERLAQQGVGSIKTAEGLAALDRVLGGGIGQVVVLRAKEPVLQRLGVVTSGGPEDNAALALEEHTALDDLTRRTIAAWFAANPIPPDQVVASHRKLFDALGDLRERSWSKTVSMAGMTREQDAFAAAHPGLAPHVALLRQCVNQYRPLLQGERAATDVMFPGGSMALVEGIYSGDRLTAYCNAQVARAVRDIVLARRGKSIRILEIGAGTGGTTGAVLEVLEASRIEAAYTYTDVSRAFTLHGERKFGARYPFVSFGVLDLGRDPCAQGYRGGSFDLVIGANVVHTTADLEVSGGRLRRLLAPRGALVLYEMTALSDFATATFGLLDGWWTFTDQRLRHAPLLDAPGWSRLLQDAGFASVALNGIGGTRPQDYRHTIIVANTAADLHPAIEKATAMAADPALGQRSLVAAVHEVVAEILQMRIEQLSPDRNFADYGADSIISVDLVAALGARFGIVLKPTILFSHPTVEKLAEHLFSRHGIAGSAVMPQSAARIEAPTVPVRQEDSPPALLPRAWADDIAIIGMAGRFPGAETVDAFWLNIVTSIDSVTPVPRKRWDHAAIYGRAPMTPGKTQCPAGGFLADIDLFDPLFFNLSPAEAVLMDPQQRLFLQEAWHALEDAGYAGPHPSRARCGVFVGTVAGDYDRLLREADKAPDVRRFMGNASSMLAGRVAYGLGLNGPCLSIDTACSSSLVAVQLACESLARGETDMALAGGVAILTTSDFYLAASHAGMLSPSGRCRTLDAGADGFVPGEAVGVIVLKRRVEAERDGDRILALIKGAGTNQDGSSNGITAPSGVAQTALQRMVYDRFDIDPATLGYIELHGTGTKLGDPIEIDALRAAFAGRGADCAIGSVKANIGHSLPAAGIAGLIKLVLALKNKTIPAAINFDRPNQHIDFAGGPFFIPQKARPWPARAGSPRRGAVNSFGFSGTNVHVVLEEPPEALWQTRERPYRAWDLAVFSGRDEAALSRVLELMTDWLEGDGGRERLQDICSALAHGRAHHARRAAFIVKSVGELCGALRGRMSAGGAIAADVSRDAHEARDLYLSGGVPSWEALYPATAFKRVQLPLYPFERRRCWPEPPPAAPPEGAASSASKKSASSATLALFEAVTHDLGAMQ